MKTRRPGCAACRTEAHLFSCTIAFQPAVDLAIERVMRLRLGSQRNIFFLPNAAFDPKAYIQKMRDTAAQTGFPLKRLTLEFTEQERISDNSQILDRIGAYRRHGFKIAFDHFGTSCSGLSRQADLKPDIIKLDRDLIENIDQDRTGKAIVANLVKQVQDPGLTVAAAGFERPAEVETAGNAGIRFI